MTRLAMNPVLRRLSVLALPLIGAVACDSPSDVPQSAPVAVASVEITTPFALLAVDETITLQVRLLSAEGAVLDRPVAWSSSNTAVASVSATGLLAARAEGITLIRATSEGVEASVTITVRAEAVVSAIEILGPGAELVVGQAFPLTVHVRDQDGVLLERPVEWSSSDTAVASVSAAGIITARAAGRADITAAAGGRQAAIAVVVANVPAVATQLLPASVQAGSPGFELVIRGTGFVPGATVRWAGGERSARVISSTEVRIDISAADVQHPGAAEIQVLNPGQTLGSRLYFIIGSIPATRSYTLAGLAWDENPLLPVLLERWYTLEDNIARWHHRSVTAGTLRIHDMPYGPRTWDLTITMSVVREADGAGSEETHVFFGQVEYHSPSAQMVLRSGTFPDLTLQTVAAHNGDLVVWQSLHSSGDEQYEKAWRYLRD